MIGKVEVLLMRPLQRGPARRITTLHAFALPAPPLDLDQGLDRGPGRAPGREEGELAVGEAAADRQAPRPRAGAPVVVLGPVEAGRLQAGPVVEPRALRPLAGREAPPGGGIEAARSPRRCRRPPAC